MSALDDLPPVCFIGDVARAIRTSRRTIEKLRRARAFPIPELDSIDKRPRWAAVDVRAYAERRLVKSRGFRKAS